MKYQYHVCPKCGSIFIDPGVICEIDAGKPLIAYQEDYWKEEYQASIERCYGAALARLAESVYYCKNPIRRFLDIGSGAGKILDALECYLPSRKDCFFAIEKYPPAREFCTQNRHFLMGSILKIVGLESARAY